MKKTKRWLLVCILPQIIFHTIKIPLIILIIETNDCVYWGFIPRCIDYTTSWGHGYYFGEYVVMIILIIIPISIYFMYKWTSLYNLKKFGYKSHGEWKLSQKE